MVAPVLDPGQMLERSPIYLNNDEAAFAVQAHAIATTGHDDDGRLMPLYFNMLPSVWYQPVIVYLMYGLPLPQFPKP